MSSTRRVGPSSERRRVRGEDQAPRDTELAMAPGMRLFNQARTCEERGELERALRILQQAARCEGIAAESLQASARIQRELGQLQDAITSLTWALHHCQDDRQLSFELYVELGDVNAQLGDFDEATYYYRRAERYDHLDVSLQRRLRSAAGLAVSQAVPIDIARPEPASPDWDCPVEWELEDWELATG